MELLKEREGMQIYKAGDTVVKIAKDEANREAIKNSWRFLKALNGKYAPLPLELTDDSITMEYVHGNFDPMPENIEQLRMNATHAIRHFRDRNVIHGDLTHVNFIIRDSCPIAIDWDQAVFSWEPKPQKRPLPDSHHLYRAICDMELDPSRVLIRWRAMWGEMGYYLGWGSLLDLGTHRGDFCGLAAAEGMVAVGIDNEKIRPCIDDAEKYWGYMDTSFYKDDFAVDTYGYLVNHRHNVIIMLSTWPYVVQDHGLEVAKEVLRKCIRQSDVFIFETQLYGDGPGPEFLKTLEDVESLLVECGATKTNRIITIPVGGRPAERTLFGVYG